MSQLPRGEIAELSFRVRRRDGNRDLEIKVAETPGGVYVTPRADEPSQLGEFVASLSIPEGQSFVVGDIVLRSEAPVIELRVPVTISAANE